MFSNFGYRHASDKTPPYIVHVSYSSYFTSTREKILASRNFVGTCPVSKILASRNLPQQGTEFRRHGVDLRKRIFLVSIFYIMDIILFSFIKLIYIIIKSHI